MAEITIQHAASTALRDADTPPQSTGLGGALHRPTSESMDLPERYQLVGDTNEEIGKLLDTPGSVLGSSEEILFSQLERIHPAPEPGLSMLHYTTFQYTPSGEAKKRRYHWDRPREKTFKGWLVLDHPRTTRADLQHLQEVTQRIGPLMLAEELAGTVGDIKEWRELGFTWVARRWGLVQLNFNPRRTRQFDYRQKVQAYHRRTQQRFKEEWVHALYYCLRPRNSAQRYHLLYVKDDQLASRKDVLELLRTMQKLFPAHYAAADWRAVSFRGGYQVTRRGRYVESLSFQDAITRMLPLVHAEEAAARRKTYPVYDTETGEPTGQTTLLPEAKDTLALCRFIRREAKAMGMKIPPKPRLPTKPKRKRSRRARDRKAKAAKALTGPPVAVEGV